MRVTGQHTQKLNTLAFIWLVRASIQTYPLFGPFGMNQGTIPPTIPQNRVITDMAITNLSSAIVVVYFKLKRYEKHKLVFCTNFTACPTHRTRRDNESHDL